MVLFSSFHPQFINSGKLFEYQFILTKFLKCFLKSIYIYLLIHLLQVFIVLIMTFQINIIVKIF